MDGLKHGGILMHETLAGLCVCVCVCVCVCAQQLLAEMWHASNKAILSLWCCGALLPSYIPLKC